MNSKHTIQEVMREYLELLNEFFSPLYRHLGDSSDHAQVAEIMGAFPVLSNLILNCTDGIHEAVFEFWNKNFGIIEQATRELSGLRCHYTGDISPLDALQFVKRTSMYVDTVILPDPIFNLAAHLRPLVELDGFYLRKLIRHALNMARLGDVLTLETEFPVVMVAPISLEVVAEEAKENIIRVGSENYLEYAGNLFGRRFSEEREVMDYVKRLRSTQEFFDALKEKDAIPANLSTNKSMYEFSKSFMSMKEAFRTGLEIESVGSAYMTYARSQFIRSEEARVFSDILGSEQIYDNDRAWHFSTTGLSRVGIDRAIVQALQHAKFRWLGNVPIDAIRALRKDGELEDMRAQLRKGIFDIRTCKRESVERVAEQVQANLENVFAEHSKRLSEIAAKVRKIEKKEVPVAIAGGLVGLIPGVGNVLSPVFSIQGLLELKKKYKAAVGELRSSETDHLSLLIKAKNDS